MLGLINEGINPHWRYLHLIGFVRFNINLEDFVQGVVAGALL